MRRTLGVIAFVVLLAGCGSHRSTPARPAIYLLAPSGSSVTVQPVRASGGEPAELVVSWHHDRAPGSFGASIWVQRGSIWRREYELSYRLSSAERFEAVSAVIGDATGDGHADAVIQPATNGSAGCSDYHVIALLDGRLRKVLTRTNACESAHVTPSYGGLVVARPVGPCWYQPESAHCYGGTQTDLLRWSGGRYKRVGTTVKCNTPALDPKRSCRARL